MELFRDYLREQAKFYCPPVNSRQTGSAAVTDVELQQVLSSWESDETEFEARRDAQLVDALINVLNDQLGEDPVPEPINGRFQQLYADEATGNHRIRNEVDARACVDRGQLIILNRIMSSYENPIDIDRECSPPNVRSKVDFVLSMTEGKKALVEVKAPSVFDLAAEEFYRLFNDEVGLRVPLNLRSPDTGMKVIVKAYVYMVLYKVEWLALTCYTNWVFLRLHSRGAGEVPYMTYSTIEEQLDNTRPFRALLGMMMAIARDIDVPSNANMDGQLRPAPVSVIEGQSNGPEPPEQRDPSFKGRGQVTRDEPPETRSRSRRGNLLALSPGFLITWAPKTMSNKKWLEFHAVDTDTFPPLNKGTIRLHVQRGIGYGSTGTVFEVIPDGDEHNGALESRRYAIKTIGKGETDQEKGCTRRLLNELAIYRRIGQASSVSMKIVPQCYGLFESTRTLALVMDYEGDVLSRDENWPELTRDERRGLYEAILTLHKLGVYHGDLEPRNIVRDSNGSFKIIDFTSSTLHNCSQRNGCTELARVRRQLRLYDERVQLPERRFARSSSPFHNVM
ncbi:kinase-like protein [Fomitiporia mediterranea MF3/22]|uniref:kinase-like protein n=1 Tax=Fomitiporia mediterranea (strain MF3/22) TaxID=694068 RepID=UPI00044090EB|nr:kinase-like protein [Fomitiporia mediterranea MF3/22]EJD05076.1 kinase-like protein [Fomitiporia mediterranea MF3/22]